MIKRTLLILTLFSAVFCGQEKQYPVPQIKYNPASYVCYRSPQIISIDGDIYDHPWVDAEWSNNFVDIIGSENDTPLHNTRVKMLWDDQYFYIAAEMTEDNIWAKIKKHDSKIYLDNAFEIFVDPDNDTHNYIELEINAYNTIWDLLLTKPYRDGKRVGLTDWDIKGLKRTIKIYGTLNNPDDTDSKWTVEAAIPWKAFRELTVTKLPPGDNDQWKVNFARVQWDTEIDNGRYIKSKDPETGRAYPENYSVWSPQGIRALHYPEMWGLVQFSYKVLDYGNTEFIKTESDEIKWLLRKVYYAQRTHFMNYKRYSTDLTELKIVAAEYGKFNSMPLIEVTSSGFVAIIKYGDRIFTITDDGKVTERFIK